MVKLKDIFVRASEHLTGKFVKTPKKSANFDDILLNNHEASFVNFAMLLKERNAFKLQLKDYLLILRD